MGKCQWNSWNCKKKCVKYFEKNSNFKTFNIDFIKGGNI